MTAMGGGIAKTGAATDFLAGLVANVFGLLAALLGLVCLLFGLLEGRTTSAACLAL